MEPTFEILDDGGPVPRAPRPSAGPGPWLLRHRPVVALVALAGLVAAGTVAGRVVAGPQLPALVVQQVSDPAGFTGGGVWQQGADGRPAGPVRFTEADRVRRTSSSDQASVLGLVGPGVVDAESTPSPVPASGPGAVVQLSSGIDCRRVPDPVPPGAYGLRVQAGSGGDLRVGVVSAGAAARHWAAVIQSACSAWTARQTLTVTGISTQVDPVEPVLGVTFTVTDGGPWAATIDRTPAGGPDDPVTTGTPTVNGPLPLRVPAHGAVTATVSVRLGDCDLSDLDGIGQDISAGQLAGILTDGIGLSAAAPAPAAASSGAPGAYTPVVLSTSAATALRAGMLQACGGPPAPVLLLRAGHYDAASGELTLDAVLDLAPGRVRSATVVPLPAPQGAPAVLRPERTSPQVVVADRSGQVSLSLVYGPVGAARCVPPGGLIVVFTLQVPQDNRVRQVPFPVLVDLGQMPGVQVVNCAQ